MRGNRQICIALGLLAMMMMTGAHVSAQLITDSDARLKTSSKKREGFINNQKRRKVPTSSPRPVFERKTITSRSSPLPVWDSGISFFRSNRSRNRFTASSGPTFNTRKGVAPRYSQPQQSGVLALSSAPRYSSGSPFTAKSRKVQPRYSVPSSKGVLSLASGPRYSPGSPFQAGQYKVKPRYSRPAQSGALSLSRSPRYSPGSPFRPKDFNVRPRYSQPAQQGALALSRAPRYSPGSPFKPADHKVSPRYSRPNQKGALALSRPPRYSPGSPFSPSDLKVKPRYSPGSPFTRQDVTVRPRYSQGVSYPSWVYNVKPRYSPEPPFSKSQHRVSPRYSIEQKYSIKRYWQLRTVPVRGTVASYTGPVKIKGDKKRDFHPSASYLNATHASSAQLKDAYRSWSILWNRVYGNNAQPPPVKEKVSKPKFDKKEREIWNN